MFLILADVAIKISICPTTFSRFLYTLLFLMISFAPTDVAIILSLGNKGLGSINASLWKPKFFIPLAHAPMFSES